MLEFMRRHTESWLFRGILALVIISFVGWGVSDMIQAQVPTTAVKVNKVQVSVYDLARDYQNQTSAQAKQLAMLPEGIRDAIQAETRNRILQQNVDRALITDISKELNLVASNDIILDYIKQMRDFANEEGQFDPTIYKNVLLNAGLTPESFETSLAKDLVRAQLLSIFNEVGFVNEKALERGLQTEYELRDINMLTLTEKHLKNKAQATEDQLKGHYEATSALYMTEEKRSGQMLVLSLERLEQSINITEAQARDMYENHKDLYISKERRHLSRIAVDSKEKAQKVRAELEAGKDFAEVAKKHSTDILTKENGGDMGLIAMGELSPSFEKAAFALKEGEVSKAIETPFGLNIIKVKEIIPAKPQSFDQVRAQIVKELKLEQAENAYDDLIATVEDALASGEDLAKVAQENNLELTTIKETTQEAATDFPATVVNELFTLDEGETSILLTFDDKSEGYVKVSSVTPAMLKPFTEVKQEVRKAYLELQTQEALKGLAETMVKQVQAGSSLKAVMRQQGIKSGLTSYLDVARQAGSDAIAENVRTAAFSIPSKGLVTTPLKTEKGYALVEVTDTSVANISKEMRDEFAEKLKADQRNALYAQFMLSLKESADIDYNQRLINQAFNVVEE